MSDDATTPDESPYAVILPFASWLPEHRETMIRLSRHDPRFVSAEINKVLDAELARTKAAHTWRNRGRGRPSGGEASIRASARASSSSSSSASSNG